MTVASSLQRYLSEQGIHYDVVSHAPTPTASRSAQVSHVSGHRLAKAVILRDASGYLMAVLPASRQIAFDALEALLHRHLELASEAEAAGLFSDCERGAMPAAGTAYGLDMVLDDSLDEQADVYIEGGDHSSLLHLNHENFARLMTKARHGRFSHFL